VAERYQFSILDLLRLTLIVSLVLTTGVLFAGSEPVNLMWLWLAYLGIVATWYHGRWRNLRQASASRSFWFYVLSLAIPAFQFDSSVVFGAVAWLDSYWIGFGSILELLDPAPKTWPQISIGLTLPLACLGGAMANSLIMLSWIAFYIARRKRNRPIAARWLARAASVLMLACITPFVYHGGLSILYPGYALWLASAAVMAITSPGGARNELNPV